MITLIPVSSRRTLRAFVRFPEQLYRSNKWWVPPLRKSETSLLSPSRNPSLRSARHIRLLALNGQRVVGRIACFANGYKDTHTDEEYARFGWCDFEDDPAVSTTLFKAVEDWVRAKSIHNLRGPFGFTNLDKAGLLVDGFERIPTMATLYNYAYYSNHLVRLGYSEDLKWVEYLIEVPSTLPERLSALCDAVTKRYGLQVVRFGSGNGVLEYRNKIFDLLDEAYADLPGYQAFTEEQREWYASRFLRYVDPRFVSIITSRDGNVVAFSIMTPSFSAALQKAKGKLFPLGWLYLKEAMAEGNELADMNLIAIARDFRNKGVNGLIFRESIQALQTAGVKWVETNPELEHNDKVQAMWRRYNPEHVRTRLTYARNL